MARPTHLLVLAALALGLSSPVATAQSVKVDVACSDLGPYQDLCRPCTVLNEEGCATCDLPGNLCCEPEQTGPDLCDDPCDPPVMDDVCAYMQTLVCPPWLYPVCGLIEPFQCSVLPSIVCQALGGTCEATTAFCRNIPGDPPGGDCTDLVPPVVCDPCPEKCEPPNAATRAAWGRVGPTGPPPGPHR